MAKFRLKPVEAVQLTWENWDEVCEFVGVGKLSEGNPEGCFLDDAGNVLPEGHTSDILGLKIPQHGRPLLVAETEWIIKRMGTFFSMNHASFQAFYEPDC